MSISQLKDFPTPAGFEPHSVKLVQLGDIENPVRQIEDLLRVIREIRQTFPKCVLAFAKPAINWDKEAFYAPVSNDHNQAGWHLHLGCDTVNISNNSSIPTVITSQVMIAVAAILKTLNTFYEVLKGLPGAGIMLPLTWAMGTGEMHSFSESFIEHINIVRADLKKVLESRETDVKKIQQILDHCRYAIELMQPPETGMAIHRVAQHFVPEEFKLYLNPQKLGAYVIPEELGHARSVVGQPDVREEAERSIVVTIDNQTGELDTFMGMQQTASGYDLIREK